MFTTVAMIFQQILTNLHGAESEEDRIMVITKIALIRMKQIGHQNSGVGFQMGA
jgi:hypothetical protein